MREIVLASASPRRRELLEQAGICFRVCKSEAEENIGTKDPAEAVEALSFQKCEDVFQKCGREVLVIGADTVVAFEGEIFGKPASKEKAKELLRRLQGKTHQVYTGVTVLFWEEGQVRRLTFHEKGDVSFYPMTEEEITSYAETGEPMDKAGGYGIQGKAVVFIREIRGDYNTIVGLPLARLYQELKKAGIDCREWKK